MPAALECCLGACAVCCGRHKLSELLTLKRMTDSLLRVPQLAGRVSHSVDISRCLDVHFFLWLVLLQYQLWVCLGFELFITELGPFQTASECMLKCVPPLCPLLGALATLGQCATQPLLCP